MKEELKMSIPEWDVFCLLGITEIEKQEKLLPLIREKLNAGFDRTSVFVDIQKMILGKENL